MNEKIVIVEDEYIVAMDVRNNLEKNGFQVVAHVDRGEEVVALASEAHPDLILMDVSIKGDMDGIEAAMQIRQKFNIPVIFLTAFANQSTLDRARLAEPYGYLLKPFEERELVIAIEMAIYKHRMEKKLRESEERYRVLIETSPDAIGVYSLQERKFLAANQKFLSQHGFSSIAELETWKWSDFVADVDVEALKQQSQRVIREKIDAFMEVTARRKDGGVFPAEFSLAALRDIHDNPTAIVFIGRDISRRKKTEMDLRKLTQAVEQSANTVLLTDADGKIEYVNPKFTEVTGYSMAEVIGLTPRVLRSGRHEHEFYRELWQTIKSGQTWRGQFQNKRKEGDLFWEDATIAPVYDAGGTLINFVAIKEDVTARKLLEEKERDQRRLAEALRDTAVVLSSTLNLDDVLGHILDNIGRIVNYDTALVLLVGGDSVRNIRYRNNPQSTAKAHVIGDIQANLLNVPILKSMLKTKETFIISDIQHDERWQILSIPGMQRVHSLVCVPIEIQGDVVGVLNVISATPNFFSEVDAQRIKSFASQAAVAIYNAQLYEKARRLAVTDPLTELFNMRYFLDLAKIDFERARRYERNLAVAMLDVDHFKLINDTYGHSFGDAVLCEIANRLKRSVRTVDVIARYGGEEFIILMPETIHSESYRVAERIRAWIAEHPIEIEQKSVSITVSIGVTEINADTKDINMLIKEADKALYVAKAAGRNRVEASRPLS